MVFPLDALHGLAAGKARLNGGAHILHISAKAKNVVCTLVGAWATRPAAYLHRDISYNIIQGPAH